MSRIAAQPVSDEWWLKVKSWKLRSSHLLNILVGIDYVLIFLRSEQRLTHPPPCPNQSTETLNSYSYCVKCFPVSRQRGGEYHIRLSVLWPYFNMQTNTTCTLDTRYLPYSHSKSYFPRCGGCRLLSPRKTLWEFLNVQNLVSAMHIYCVIVKAAKLPTSPNGVAQIQELIKAAL